MIRLKSHNGSIESSAAHGDRLISGGFDQSICLWSRTGSLVKKLKKAHDHMIRCLTVFVDSTPSKDIEAVGSDEEKNVAYLVSGSWDCTLKVWALQTGKLIHILEGHSHRVKSVVSIDQQSVSTMGHIISASDDNTLKIWDVKLGQCLKSIDAHSHFILSVCVCYNIKLTKEANKALEDDKIKTTGTAREIKEETTTTEQQKQQEEEDIKQKTIVDGQLGTHLIASSSSDNTLQLRNLRSGELIHDLLHLSNKTIVSTTVFCPKSDKCKVDMLCAGCDNGRIVVFDISSFTLLATLDGHEAQVTSMCLSLSSSSSLLFSVSRDGYLRSWLLNERIPGDIKADIGGILGASTTTNNSGKLKANDKQPAGTSSVKKQQYHLFTCSSTNSVSVAQETQQSHENGKTVGQKIKNSEELIIGGSDGLLLVLSITTIVNGSDFDEAQGAQVSTGTVTGLDTPQTISTLSQQSSRTTTDSDPSTLDHNERPSSISLPAIHTSQSMESTTKVGIDLSSSSLDESGLPGLTLTSSSNGTGGETATKDDAIPPTGSSSSSSNSEEGVMTDGNAGDTATGDTASIGTGLTQPKSSLLNYLKSTANEEFQMSLVYDTGNQNANSGSNKDNEFKIDNGDAVARAKKDDRLYRGTPRNSFESTDSDIRIRHQRIGRSLIQNTKQNNSVPAYCLLADNNPLLMNEAATNIDVQMATMLIDTDIGNIRNKAKASSGRNRNKKAHRPLDMLIASGKKC